MAPTPAPRPAVQSATYDVVIIGGGHNGLTCAAYLAAAGLKVKVLERRHIVGGAAVTEEFHPGFRNSVASYTVSLLNPQVIGDLELAKHGLRVVERKLNSFLPLPDGRYLKAGTTAQTQAEVAKFSNRDAEALPRYYATIEAACAVLRDLVLETPPNAGGGLGDLVKSLKLGNRLRRLGLPQQRELVALFTGSAGDYLDGWFASDPIKGLLGFDSIVGTYASPYNAGTAYVLLHHAFGEVNGKTGVWGHAIGGMGAITQAMARAATARGVDIEVDAPVARVLVANGRAAGVELEDGRVVRGRAVASNLNPRLLFERLIDPGALDDEFRRRIAGYKCRSASFRMNVALAELPDFSCLPGSSLAEHHGAGIFIGPSLGYMDRAHREARAQGWSPAPVIEMLIPSTIDDSLAPPGRHVASLFCQHFAPELPDGRGWDEAREAAADTIIDTVTAYAPNFKASVIARQIHSPLDLERKFGLIGGDIFHGNLSLDQLFSARPVLGHADYRAPVPGLYMCGSGTHPGGGVTGLPGRNAAREIAADFRRGWVGHTRRGRRR